MKIQLLAAQIEFLHVHHALAFGGQQPQLRAGDELDEHGVRLGRAIAQIAAEGAGIADGGGGDAGDGLLHQLRDDGAGERLGVGDRCADADIVRVLGDALQLRQLAQKQIADVGAVLHHQVGAARVGNQIMLAAKLQCLGQRFRCVSVYHSPLPSFAAFMMAFTMAL